MSHSEDERRLILLSAGTRARRESARSQTRALIPTLDPEQLAGTLRARKLLTVLGPHLLDLAEGSLGENFERAVEEALETGRRQGGFLQLISLRVSAMLATAGIRSSPLKGPQLSELIYADHGRRLSSDVDLLVASDQLGAAVDVVRELGYEAPSEFRDRDGLPQLHFALIHPTGELPPVELHWRIHWYERQFAQERLLPPGPSATEDWRPAPIDELAALLLFYARDGFIDLRLAADLGAWWDTFGSEVPSGALDELTRAYPAFSRVLPVTAKVAEMLIGVPCGRIMTQAPELKIRNRIAIGLANPNPHSSPSQLYADRGLVDGLLSPRGGGIAFVRRQIVPPREVLAEHARHAGRAHVRSSVARAFGVLSRYALSLGRLLLAGSWRLQRVAPQSLANP